MTLERLTESIGAVLVLQMNLEDTKNVMEFCDLGQERLSTALGKVSQKAAVQSDPSRSTLPAPRIRSSRGPDMRLWSLPGGGAGREASPPASHRGHAASNYFLLMHPNARATVEP
jgi:hypothetical protein